MAGLLLASVWCLLLAGAELRSWLGAEVALCGAYLTCAALLLATRARSRPPASLVAAGLAAAAGFLALPAWLASMGGIGVGLGLPPAPRASAGAAGATAWIAHAALAPLFEELLYRERLLPALRARIGTPLALMLSSALFAAPHLEPWSVLTTFAVGLALGGVFLATGRSELCVAYHAGLNAAVLACGLPPRGALQPLESLLAGGVLLALACRWTRGCAAHPAVHATPQGPRVPRPRPA